MDIAPIPSVIRPGETFFNAWDGELNPRYFIQVRYGEMSCEVNDKRTYSDEVVKHLEKNGAHLLSKAVSIPNSGKEEQDAMEALMNGPPGVSRTYLYKDNVVTFNAANLICLYHPLSKESVLDEFKGYLKEVKDARVSILLSAHGELYVDSIDFEPPVIDDMALNYGTGFPKIHTQITDKLNAKGAGLYLLHGPAGCGKTSYIKHLTSIIKREFIFIPVGMAGELSSPSFVKTLLSHKEAVLILEDAEQALQSREVDSYNSSTVSTLLNLSDGVLGCLLNVAIIASFNSDKSAIDKALLRKGRLAFDYTFDKLSIPDATKLAKHLKKDIAISEPTSLADIYNASVSTNYTEPKQKMMGFGR